MERDLNVSGHESDSKLSFSNPNIYLEGAAMVRYMLELEDLGYETSWLLIQQVIGMPDPKMQSDFLTDKMALLLFFRPSMPERLCITAAVRQMSGTTVYQGNPDEGWAHEVQNFQELLMPIFDYYLDIIYFYGLPVQKLRQNIHTFNMPLINAGSPDAHPAHALADVACMLKYCKNLEGQEAAWIGCANGTLYSLIEAAAWFKFSVRISLPEKRDANSLVKKAASVNANISFASSPAEAVKNVNFIYAGWKGDLSEEELKIWTIDPKLMSLANDKARLLLCASPMRAINISPEVLSKASVLTRQAEYRLRLHKRLLHWVLQK